jgi:large conductance mechanosensitive channel
MGFVKDFKAFAMKGSVVDLAVGVVIGAAFAKIVTSLVEDIFMPFIGLLTGKGQMFTDKFYVLKPAKEGEVYTSLEQARKAGANVFAYGHAIQTIFDFIIIAFCIFLAVKAMTKVHIKAAEAPKEPSSTDKLLMEIRDELRKKG